MTRYRIVCVDGRDVDEIQYDSAEEADEVRVERDYYLDKPMRCGPHTVEAVRDDGGRLHLDTAIVLTVVAALFVVAWMLAVNV